MKSRLLAAVAITAMIAPGMAMAEDGWYGRAAIGGGTTEDIDLNSVAFASGSREIQSGGHILPQLALGYGLENSGFRVELELGHQYDDTGAVGNFPNTSSDIQSYEVMGNVLYDFNEDAAFTPFLGVGLGLTTQVLSAFGPGFSVHSDDTAVAYQAIAGLSYRMTDRLRAETYYRYFAAPNAEFDSGPTEYDLDGFVSHDVMIGLRWDFQADAAPPPPPPPPPPPAPPPPPPPPPPAPSCENVAFVVYFEWDKSFLTDQAKSIISQAADRAEECGVASVRIEGHADRSGPASYNVGLSERRADAVKQQLMNEGVSASSITTEAFGESQPAVETPDGVREPLNRRSEVVIRVNGSTS